MPPTLPVIVNIPASEFLATSRGNIMTNYGLLSAAGTTTLAGLLEIATDAEILAGTDAERAITPSGLNTYVATMSGDWSTIAFTELTDVATSALISGDLGKVATLTETSSGVYEITLEDPTFIVQDSQMCINHDFTSGDVNYLLPSIASWPDAAVSVVRAGSGTTVTLTPSGSDTIQGLSSQFISDNSNDIYSSIFLRAIGYNWTIMFGVGEWKRVTTESIPASSVEATPRYGNDTTITAINELNQRAYVSETYTQAATTGALYSIPANTWTPRRLNTLDSDPLSIVTSNFGSYRFKLPAGKYKVAVNATVLFVNAVTSYNTRFRLYNVTSSSTLVNAPLMSNQSTATSYTNVIASFDGSFTLTQLTDIELQQYHSFSSSLNPFHWNGTTDVSGQNNVLVNIEIEKIS